MSASNFLIKIFTQRGLLLEDISSSAKIPTSEGEIQILPQHIKYIGVLSTGILEYESHPQKDVTRIAISEGICFFEDDALTILADNALYETALVNNSEIVAELNQLKQKVSNKSQYDVETICMNKRLSYLETIQKLVAEQ